MSAGDWCLGQTVRQMDTDEVVDLVLRQNAALVALGEELDQMRIRAEMAEDEREVFRRHLQDADDELADLRALLAQRPTGLAS